MKPLEIAQAAREQLQQLTGLKVDTVSKLQKVEDGWLVNIEILEVRAVPDTKDLLGTYEVQLDAEGNVLSYQRTNRYRRGEVK